MAVEYSCCETEFFVHILVIVFLVLFAGLMSGLTLGLMSLSLVDLEVLAKSGTPRDKQHAAKILPVVKNQHLLLCTLLICNAAAMEALPIFLDSLVTAWGAILISVTLILLFGEIIPQSVCSRYGLAIGAAVAPMVRILVWICFPVAYPISKLLDYLLGHRHRALFRRAELKTLVNLHGNEAGKGGELTHDETTIIAGALELSEKTASDAMTPISETFTIDVNATLDRDLMSLILEKGHSRVPVYYEQPTNIIGLVLVKNLLTIHPEDRVPVKSVTIRRIPRVAETMPLYDILNEFQKGHSHMAVVVRQSTKMMTPPPPTQSPAEDIKDVRVDIDGEKNSLDKSVKTNKRPLQKWKSFPNNGSKSFKGGTPRSKKWTKNMYSDILQIDGSPLPKLPEEEEAVGVITMEDVIEELLQRYSMRRIIMERIHNSVCCPYGSNSCLDLENTVAYPISKLLCPTLLYAQYRQAKVEKSHMTRQLLLLVHLNETACDAMTRISETFTINVNATLDRDLMSLILEKGHSRVIVYYEQPTNIIGLVLVKNLLTIHPEDRVPVKSVTIRRIPRVAETMPLYDILNEFQKSHSHMAVVVRQSTKMMTPQPPTPDVRVALMARRTHWTSVKTKRPLQKWKSFLNNGSKSFKGGTPRSKKWTKNMYLDILQIDGSPLPKLPEEEAVRVITMEDVIQELLQ
ncbi:CBS domain-containing family protein, partial [Striga asiatica]